MKNTKGWLCLWALLLTIATILLLSVPQKVSYEVLEAHTALAGTSAINSTSTPAKEKEIAEPTQKAILPKMPQVLLDISWCESRNDQSKVGYNYHYETVTLADGSTTTQKVLWSKDIGRWQINDYYHAEEAKRLGFDIYTEEGNALYALRLYNTNGTRDWNPSKPCWSDIEAWRAKEKSYY